MKKVWKWVIASVVVVLLFLVASEAMYVQRRGQVIKEADAAAHRFLVTLQDHQYTAAYGMLDAREKLQVSPASLRKELQSLEKPDGLDWVPPNCDEYHPNDSLTSVVLSYSVELKGGMPMRIEMTQTPDGWRVSDYRFNESPA